MIEARALVFALSCLILSSDGYSDESRHQSFDLIVDRQISIEVLEALELPDRASIAIDSTGGDPALFRALSDLFRERRATLHFVGKCFSACAEYLFTTNTEKHFYPSTLIGLHWNAAINNAVTAPIASERCRAQFRRATERRALHLTGNEIDPDFWVEVLSVLNALDVTVVDEDTCSYSVVFENQLWIPSASELHELTGLEVPFNICNEQPACVESMYRPQTRHRIVVGARQYIAEKQALIPLDTN